MIAYKGVTKDMVAAMGTGRKVLKVGETYVEDKSQTASCGWHCTENPLDCLRYFPLGAGNRYFLVEAAGDIDEDGTHRIACTEITLLQELSVKRMAFDAMKYIINHPRREKWEQVGRNLNVARDKAHATYPESIAIARGERPIVTGPVGSFLGLILETEPGKIVTVKMFTPSPEQAGKWITVTPDRELVEVTDEEAVS